MIKVALIANGSAKIGGGHIARCLTLGRALIDKGAAAKLIIKPDAMDLIEGLELGDVDLMPSEFDVASLNAIIDDADVIVTDNYDWMASTERELGKSGRRMVVIDDLANRQHDCDLLVDQNFGRNPVDYMKIVPKEASLLIGLNYALLRPEFSVYRITSIARRNENVTPERVLVTLGMTDLGGVTAKAVKALRSAGIREHLDVVVTRVAPSLPELELLAQSDDKLHLHIEPEEISILMMNADVALGALGATTWERFCMGLPTVGLVLAENQELAAKRLDMAGLVTSFKADETGLLHAAETLRHMLDNASVRQGTAHLVAAKVDGKGASRVADAIFDLAA